MKKVLILMLLMMMGNIDITKGAKKVSWKVHTLFSVECQNYFDWQTVGLMNSYRKAKQPGPITRLLSCTDEEKKNYKGMHLAPTFEVPSMSRHPRTGDWYPAINKPAGVVHWLKHSKEAKNVDWVLILDADMIIRGPILPWELGAEKGRPVAAYYGYLKGCDNILAKLHTKHPDLCDKVGGLLAFHISDLRRFAPLWLSKTEEVREDKEHWATNITGDIYGKGWISEMYGYSFGAAEIGLRHKINDNLMLYPGYVPREGIEPVLLHYGLPFSVGNWSFNKLAHHDDGIVYECNRLFPEPPYPKEVLQLELDANRRRGLFISIECINTINEGLLLQHGANGCPKPAWSKYLSFLKSKSFAELTKPKYVTPATLKMMDEEIIEAPVDRDDRKAHPKIHTVFSTECTTYFDWQTVGLMHSFRLSGQPGNITRLLSCNDEDLRKYKGNDLAPTHYVPSMSRHPLTGDWYPAINKPAAVLHWLNHVNVDAEYIVILDADMIMRGPITPWEFKASRGHPVSTPYDYLIGCDNELAKLHTSHPEACDKVGGVIIMHIDDLRKFAMLWLHKTEEVRADRAHYARNITGDIYESGWISEMYGYSFGAAELKLKHTINSEILIYPGYVPALNVKYRVFHYGLRFSVGNWSFDKADWREVDMVNRCWSQFPDPPDSSTLDQANQENLRRDMLSIECAKTLNQALELHHKKKCPSADSILISKGDENTEERGTSKEIGNTDASIDSITNHVATNNSGELASVQKEELSSVQKEELASVQKDEIPKSLRFWVVFLWAFSGFGFLVVIFLVYSGHSKRRTRMKHPSRRRRSFQSGFMESNGRDRHGRDVDL
ncbi:peptidyl serine alpha-galactosyltransferase-like [Trifolium pratense]|uniref:peptidyl serine alpha-galactosyltransferase-like n=1 Tax=Trifolium pratense TaxID=57577 RepID=UPI001E694F01|nr:peptidyl serine alpha-galactosyltransferase-like [Trifolium pratense]